MRSGEKLTSTEALGEQFPSSSRKVVKIFATKERRTPAGNLAPNSTCVENAVNFTKAVDDDIEDHVSESTGNDSLAESST